MPLSSTVRSLVIAMCLLAGATAFAADLGALKNTTPAERAKAQTAMMKEKLGLNDEQLSKIGALNLEYAQKMDPIIKGTEGPFMKARDVRNVEEQKEAALKGLLSADQFQKFQAMKEDMREHLMEQIQKQAGS